MRTAPTVWPCGTGPARSAATGRPSPSAGVVSRGYNGAMSDRTAEQTAEACHEANRIVQHLLGEDLNPEWVDAPAEMRESTLAGVEAAWAGQDAQQIHESWCAERRANGWVHGTVKDRDAKTHPCLVEYHELPMAQRMKDVVFSAIASAAMFADA
jgi:hypothetical protein